MRIALICPEMHGHLNPMTTLGRELHRRGHEVTLIGTPMGEAKTTRAGLNFHAIAREEHASGKLQTQLAKLGNLTGIAALKFTGELLKQQAVIGLRDLPQALKDQQAEAVIVDQVSPAGAAVAEVMGLPFVVACNALALHQEPGVPPGTLPWKYSPTFLGRLRNRLGNLLLKFAARPIFSIINQYRGKHGHPPIDAGSRHEYGLAHLAQQPAFFDFPRERLPEHFHYTGPWHEPTRDAGNNFPWHQLDGRPIVYASLGTLQNRLRHVFEAIIQAAATPEQQLVMALGRPEAIWDGPAPHGSIIVPFAPQLELLDRASSVITHAGLNTALETLARGKPMLCIPVTNDQPGVAARVTYLGAGLMISTKNATAEKIAESLEQLKSNPSYREASQQGAAMMKAFGSGVVAAADIVEQAFHTKKRVSRTPTSESPVKWTVKTAAKQQV